MYNVMSLNVQKQDNITIILHPSEVLVSKIRRVRRFLIFAVAFKKGPRRGLRP